MEKIKLDKYDVKYRDKLIKRACKCLKYEKNQVYIKPFMDGDFTSKLEEIKRIYINNSNFEEMYLNNLKLNNLQPFLNYLSLVVAAAAIFASIVDEDDYSIKIPIAIYVIFIVFIAVWIYCSSKKDIKFSNKLSFISNLLKEAE